MPECEATVIHWFRRDLRLADNPALRGAAEPHLPVVPVYILSAWRGEHAWTGPNRQSFLCDSLRALAGSLSKAGGRLILRRGDAVTELRKLIREARAVAVHFNRDPDPYGKSVEQALQAACAELGVDCHAHDDAWLVPPAELRTQAGEPYRVFTPFSRNWLAREKPAPAPTVTGLRTPREISSLDLPTLGDWDLASPAADILPAGEAAAQDRLRQAQTEIFGSYARHRDFPGRAATSRLSQDLRFGLVSIRSVYAAAEEARRAAAPAERENIGVFIKELAWREFYFAILHHFPNVLEEEFNPDWRGLPWDEPGGNLERWKSGTTGFPIVDAAMRQLAATGFMHNRARMITAMFLTKDLHHDWKLGESWFMRHLVDGEIASNNGGWQWSAGTGADAAPYFRIQNPWTQTKRYDPDGSYIKRWIPELADVSPEEFHAPPAGGKPLAAGYPAPCVDHHAERERTLEIFKRHRAAAGR